MTSKNFWSYFFFSSIVMIDSSFQACRIACGPVHTTLCSFQKFSRSKNLYSSPTFLASSDNHSVNLSAIGRISDPAKVAKTVSDRFQTDEELFRCRIRVLRCVHT